MRKPQTIRSVMAENVRGMRAKRRISQQSVAEQMTALGNTWIRQTVSDVERAQREILAKELFALALVLDCSVLDLMEPESPIDYGGAKPIPPAVVRGWLRGELDLGLTWNESKGRFDALQMGGHRGTSLAAFEAAFSHLDDFTGQNQPRRSTQDEENNNE